jgi:phosphoadenylyl-sulfate reductase (thioredoxin)
VSATDDLKQLAETLEGRPPAEILAAAATRHPGRVALACSFGAEDCLLVDEIARARLPIEVFTLDTGYLFPETYALWQELEQRYGIAIRAERGAAPVVDPAATPPWEADPDGCCEVRKVVPLRTALSRLGAWVTGIRRDQTPDRADAKVIGWDGRFGLEKVNPLAAWTHEQVWAALKARGVPVNPLHARGYSSIGCAPCTTPVRPGEDPRAGRWRGKQKTECGLHFRPLPGGPPPLHPALDRPLVKPPGQGEG